MNKFFIALVALATISIALPSGTADHCEGFTTSEPEATVESPTGATFYVDHDAGQISIWVYEETNGIPGLQRGDTVKDDTCHNSIIADTIHL